MKTYGGVEVESYALTSALLEVIGLLHANNNSPWGKGTQVPILYVVELAQKPVPLVPIGYTGRSIVTIMDISYLVERISGIFSFDKKLL
jgi:hypothetical protein